MQNPQIIIVLSFFLLKLICFPGSGLRIVHIDSRITCVFYMFISSGKKLQEQSVLADELDV